LSLQHSTESTNKNKQEKEKKGKQVGKEKVRLYLFTHDRKLSKAQIKPR
jgi:hypothetical protein